MDHLKKTSGDRCAVNMRGNSTFQSDWFSLRGSCNLIFSSVIFPTSFTFSSDGLILHHIQSLGDQVTSGGRAVPAHHNQQQQQQQPSSSVSSSTSSHHACSSTRPQSAPLISSQRPREPREDTHHTRPYTPRRGLRYPGGPGAIPGKFELDLPPTTLGKHILFCFF